MTEQNGDQEPLTWREQVEWAKSERERLKALQKRTAEHAEGAGLIARLGKRLGADVGTVIAKPMPPLLEPLNDAESNARERMLRVQAELLKEQHQMTEVQYEERIKFLEQQKRELLK